MNITRRTCLLIVAFSAILMNLGVVASSHADDVLRLGRFNIDATPPIGTPLAYDPMKGEGDKLSCRGIVLIPSGEEPIVLVSIDWIGVGNGGYSAFREAIAKAAGAQTNRVAFHAIHQHDAPRCDFTADAILAKHGLGGETFDVAFTRKLIQRLGASVAQAIKNAVPVTHIAHGQAEVENVASNRRILGANGKVQFTRFTATRDASIRAMPVGTIDPNLKLVAFWNGEKPVASLTWYATHPQSYYRTGLPSPDFPGIARNLRDKALKDVLNVHFNGAGGNIGAGKWNDGAKANRMVLAKRVEQGMIDAWKQSINNKRQVSATEVGLSVESVEIPPTPHVSAEQLLKNISNAKASRTIRIRSAVHLAWLRRCEAGHKVDISCLTLGKVRVLHMPGELFVEYQLAAQKMRPDLFVAMAAYGDYAPGYIGTAIAYTQGGYEVSPTSSRVAPEAEKVLLQAVKKLLE